MLRPGDRFDRYVVEALLGEGGMGRVYRARDEKLRRSVALKVLRVERAGEGAPSGQLLHEARAAASLAHANTIAIYDVAETDGTPFIAMELVLGTSLRALVGDASVPVGTRIRYLADVARALLAAHERGILHRDIKPENVIVRHDGVVKVLDFGIARSLEPVPGDPAARETRADAARCVLETWTRTGLLGTPRYMAPEQLQGEPLDARADQFAWGVLAYELLTGSPPWDAGSAAPTLELVASMLGEAPAPIEPLARAAPEDVALAVVRALSTRPDDRFPSMADLVAILDGARDAASLDRAAPPATKPTRRRLVPLEPGIDVCGDIVNAILDGFGSFRSVAWKYVVSLGLDDHGVIEKDAWVPQAAWLDVYNAMIEEVGAGMIFNIGQNVPARTARWPPAADIDVGLRSLDVAFHMNHRKGGKPMFDAATGALAEGIGHYAYARVGEKRATMVCDNPYPCELDHGILTAVARRFESLARVEHAPLGCRTLGAPSCTYFIVWE
jgi:serine/threonine protein kinase